MMHFIRTFLVMHALGVGLWLILLSKRFEIMEKLYTLKTFLKMVGGRGFASGHSYKNYQKSLSYFSHLAPLFCSSLLIGKVKKEEGAMAQYPS